jgi:hypothetical protein
VGIEIRSQKRLRFELAAKVMQDRVPDNIQSALVAVPDANCFVDAHF